MLYLYSLFRELTVAEHTNKQLTFQALPHPDPYLDNLADFSYSDTASGWIVKVTVEAKHCNGRQITHGGFIATLADVALAYGTTYSQQPPLYMVTVHKSLDFVGTSFEGDTLYADISIKKKGKTLVLADSRIRNQNDKTIALAAGIMQKLPAK